jgi:hypothetical protein
MNFNKINNYKTTEIKVKGGYDFPKYKTTGDNSFFLGIIGGTRNAGKSTMILNLIDIEKDIMLHGKNKVYFISPTADAKVKSFAEKYPDNFEIVPELTKGNVKKVLDSIEECLRDWRELLILSKIIKKFHKGKEPLTDDELQLLEVHNFGETDELKGFNDKHPPISTMVVDDSAVSPLISQAQSRDGKYFLQFVIRHRHPPYYCNIFILTQHLKLVMRPIRVNCNMVVIFPFRDASIYESVFKEYSTLFNNKVENFLNIMSEIESRDNHSYCVIYYDKVRFVRINLDENVTFDNKDDNK